MKVLVKLFMMCGWGLVLGGVPVVVAGDDKGVTRRGGPGSVPKAVDVPQGAPAPAPLPASSEGVPAAARLADGEDAPSAGPVDHTLVSGGPSEGDDAEVDPAEWFDAMMPGFLQGTEYGSFEDWFGDRYKHYKASGLRTLLRGGPAGAMTDFFRLLELIAPPAVYMKFAKDAIVWTSRTAARDIKKGELDRERQTFENIYGGRMSTRRLREAWAGVQRGIDEDWNHVLSGEEKKFRQKAHEYAPNLGGFGIGGGAAVAAYAAAGMNSDTEEEEEENKKRRKRRKTGGGDQSGVKEKPKKHGPWTDDEEEDDGGGKPAAI